MPADEVESISLESWWSAGSKVAVRAHIDERELFVWEAGSGPAVTLLHGYPGSSHDWSQVAAQLTRRFRVIAPDLLGFGRSDKPFPYPYSIRDQADLVEQVWSHLGISESAVVAHDYSTSIAQELLRRGSPVIESVVFLNGAVYPKLHRPTDGQLALLGPDGDALAALIDHNIWSEALGATFGPGHPVTPQEDADLWSAFSEQGGIRLAAALLHYVADRAVDGEAWVTAMEAASVPRAFIWGLSDPVSGEHVITEVERRISDVPIAKLTDVGHWPMIENPDVVSTNLFDFLG
jgi:pimeloyl-ACP methyl ester carboxylesterase